MMFHENCRQFSCNIIPYFFRKLGKMSQNLSSVAVVIGALRVKNKLLIIAINNSITMYFIYHKDRAVP